jgi:CBS domain containing-hemolysin-like protein
MSLTLGTLAVLIPSLLIIEGIFAGSEISLMSADKLALKQKQKNGDRGARMALELSSQPQRVLSVTLTMTSLCVVTISALIALYFLQTGTAYASALAVLVTSPLIVLFGELIPKTIYQRHATRMAPWVSHAVRIAYWLFYPVTRSLSLYTDRITQVVAPIEELLSGKRRTTRDEIQQLLSYGKRETEIKTSERRMIKRIFDFKDTEAKHALIPLVRVEAIAENATVKEALEKFEQHRHSRMPVFSGRVDNIVGVLEAADLLTAADLRQQIRHYVTSAHYVAETQALEDLMVEMHREDNEMVVVVDEHGGAVGILTLEDIIEEIVGEINDEDDSEARSYKELSERSWLVQARMEISEINERLRLELPHGDYETLSGFLLQQFGRIPETGDELFFGAYKFTIRKATERQIESVHVERIAEKSQNTD